MIAHKFKVFFVVTGCMIAHKFKVFFVVTGCMIAHKFKITNPQDYGLYLLVEGFGELGLTHTGR